MEELIRNHVTCFCISPGSRSAPLTVAAARYVKAKTTVFYDERGAAFYALGYAKATGNPAALICTSGTAVANYYPAIIEASMDRIPLIILTADRPPELLETGANQAIRQPYIYGEYVRWRFNLPCPNVEIPPSMVLTTIDQLVYKARQCPSGPVHLNCMFREPLAPIFQKIPPGYQENILSWQKGDTPFTTFSKPALNPDKETINRLVEIISSTKRGLLVVGRLSIKEEIEAVKRFSIRLKWPVYPDIASGLRIGFQKRFLLAYFDQILLSEKVCKELEPDVILMVGARITSKRFLEFLAMHRPSHFIAIEDHPERSDPSHSSTWRIEADICEILAALEERLKSTINEKWNQNLYTLSKGIGKIIQNYLPDSGTLNEMLIARLVSQTIPDGHGMFLGNSMPIRDMDMYSDQAGSWIRIGTNRGASGIDGNIATTAGFAKGLDSPTTLIVGDLAFIHDLNSLSILERMDHQVIIIVINNRGSGIFSFLPISNFMDIFETYFGAPHDYYFEDAARLFHIPYFQPRDAGAFLNDYRAAIKGKKTVIIEVRLDREENKRLHKGLDQKIISFLERSWIK